MSEKRSVTVNIRGQELRIRSDESPELLAQIAEIVDATMRRIEERTGMRLEEDQLAVLNKHQFSPELERLMIDHLETAMMTPIISSRSQFRKLAATAIARRDKPTGQDSTDRIALAAGLFAAIYPGFLTNAHLLLSESLFIFLLLLAFNLVARGLESTRRGGRMWLWLLGAGAFWGLASRSPGRRSPPSARWH